MARRLFVHLGTAKTGTTSIQDWMYYNDEALRAAGILYPRIAHDGDQNPDFNRAHHILAFHWGQGWAQYPTEVTSAAWERFFEAARDWHGDVVISAETFVLVVAAHGAAFFDFIARNLPDTEIVPIVYFREHTDLLRSDAMEYLRNGHTGTSPFQHAVSMPWYLELILDYRRVVETMQAHDAVSRVVVRPFERTQFVGGTLLGDVLTALGHAALIPDNPPKSSNQFNDTNAMRHLLQAIGVQPFRQPFAVKLACYAAARDRKDKSGAFLWPRDFGEFLRTRHAEDRAFLDTLSGQPFFTAQPDFADKTYRPGFREKLIAATLYRRLAGGIPLRGDYHAIIERLALLDATGRLGE